MNYYQLFLIIFVLYSFIGFLKGYSECKNKQNPFGHSTFFLPIGAFVWGDAFVLGLFWMFATLIAFLFHDFFLFLFIYSVFWAIRSFGEILYWMNQQFTSKSLEQPEWWWVSKIVGNRAVWFVNQVLWQCILVSTIILSLLFGKLWIQSL